MTDAAVAVPSPPRRRAGGSPLRQVAVVEQLVEAAADEARDRGYDGLTVRTVARRAGVAPATAYTYFASKDHLLAEVLWRRLQALPGPRASTTAAPPIGGRARHRRAAGAGPVHGRRPHPGRGVHHGAARQRARGARPARPVRRRAARPAGARLGDDADEAVLRSLDLAYSGAMLWAGMGHIRFEDVPDALADAARLVLGVRRRERPGDRDVDDRGRDRRRRGALQPVRLRRSTRTPIPTYARLRDRSPAVPQRRVRLLGAVAPRRRAGRLPGPGPSLEPLRRDPRPRRLRAPRPQVHVVPGHGPTPPHPHALARVQGLHAPPGGRARARDPRLGRASYLDAAVEMGHASTWWATWPGSSPWT